jgi:hypothetical protein
MGLFKSGSLVGGSDVPLHAPSYEYDFGGLVEWLTAKFDLSPYKETTEEQNLADISIRYLKSIK